MRALDTQPIFQGVGQITDEELKNVFSRIESTENEKFPFNFHTENGVNYYEKSHLRTQHSTICDIFLTKEYENRHYAILSKITSNNEQKLLDHLVNTIPYSIYLEVAEWNEFIVPILTGKYDVVIDNDYNLERYDTINKRIYWLNKLSKYHSDVVFQYILDNYNTIKERILLKTDENIISVIHEIL